MADLDRTEVESKLKDLETELEKLESQYTRTKLDTTLNLRRKRDDLINRKFVHEERQIEVDQSKFEPLAIQRQAITNLEKAERGYNQTLENYDLEVEKAAAEVSEVSSTVKQKQRQKERMLDILSQFTVYARKHGMIIYAKTGVVPKRTRDPLFQPGTLL